jgi:hypothetical protein
MHGWAETLFLPDVADRAAHQLIISCPSLRKTKCPAETQSQSRASLVLFLVSVPSVVFGVSAVVDAPGLVAVCTLSGAIF